HESRTLGAGSSQRTVLRSVGPRRLPTAPRVPPPAAPRAQAPATKKPSAPVLTRAQQRRQRTSRRSWRRAQYMSTQSEHGASERLLLRHAGTAAELVPRDRAYFDFSIGIGQAAEQSLLRSLTGDRFEHEVGIKMIADHHVSRSWLKLRISASTRLPFETLIN